MKKEKKEIKKKEGDEDSTILPWKNIEKVTVESIDKRWIPM